MRVLLINTVCGIRSTGRICGELAKEFETNGHEAKIAYGRESVPELYSKYAIKIGTVVDYSIHALESRIFDNSGFGSIHATKVFLKWATEYNPDLLWLHNLHGYYINIELLFDWIKERPQMKVKWTLHDCWPFTGHCSHYTMAKCYKWKNGCNKCPQKKEYPASYVFDSSERNYKKKMQIFSNLPNIEIITPSNWLKKQVGESFLSNYQVTVVNNTIDLSVFRKVQSNFREQYNLEGKYIVLAVASGWGEKKGLQDCINLASILDEKYKLVIVGLTKKQISKIPNNILCIERTNSVDELVKIYSDSDVFINTTHEDNYPTVNLEARACGLPVITYDVGGSPESAGGEYIVKENDISGLKNQIIFICEKENRIR